ncbi:MAG: gamma-glutamyltransferase [Phycisphaerae bacterium]
MKRQLIFFVVGVFLTAVVAPVGAADPPWISTGTKGLVASDSAYASQAGLEILKAGGNAIDAAVAVSFALGVTRPYSTGLGGGGFMIARFADGRVVVQDFRETAPAAATRDMYVEAAKRDAKHPSPSRIGHLAVAVPGLLAGRCQALKQFGTMPLARTMGPAIELAKSGFPVDQHYVDATHGKLAMYERHEWLKQVGSYVYRRHLREGRLPSVGERLVQPELARLLEGIADSGPDVFYRGPVAKAIVREMKERGGIITEKDLADYKVGRREPIVSTYRDYTLILMPPCSSGGVALAETLNILDTVDLPGLFQRDPGLAVHYQVEAMKHAFADRACWLGDSDFVQVPVALLTSKPYARQVAARIDPHKCLDLDAYGSVEIVDDAGTSHFCVVDRWGNVVVSTETINTTFGSLAAIDEWGLILNNEMDDFAGEPGKPNAYGLMHSDRNAIAPGKRPLSSMSPTIVLKDGQPYLLLGASGGPRIISSVLNVLLFITDYGMSLEQAMLNPRPHHQWRPDQVLFDAEPPQPIKLGLLDRGHELSDQRRTGIVQAILRTNEGWVGASDPRKGGQPRGY